MDLYLFAAKTVINLRNESVGFHCVKRRFDLSNQNKYNVATKNECTRFVEDLCGLKAWTI